MADSYREWAPPPEWRHAVACCWEQQVDGERTQRVLPDGHADVLFHASGPVEIVGLQDSVSLPVLPAGTRITGIRLRPEAVARAFRIDAASLQNETVAVEDLLGSGGARRLLDGRAVDAWIRSIEPDRRAASAVELLAVDSVDDVAEEVGVSGRQLRRILLAEVGVGPKVYQRVLRLQRFLRAIDAGGTFAVAAAEAGYADQPHLTREVRRMSGLTPAALIAERRSA